MLILVDRKISYVITLVFISSLPDISRLHYKKSTSPYILLSFPFLPLMWDLSCNNAPHLRTIAALAGHSYVGHRLEPPLSPGHHSELWS